MFSPNCDEHELQVRVTIGILITPSMYGEYQPRITPSMYGEYQPRESQSPPTLHEVLVHKRGEETT